MVPSSPIVPVTPGMGGAGSCARTEAEVIASKATIGAIRFMFLPWPSAQARFGGHLITLALAAKETRWGGEGQREQAGHDRAARVHAVRFLSNRNYLTTLMTTAP